MRVEATASAEIRVSLEGTPRAVSVPRGASALEALQRLDGKAAKKAVAARIDGKVVDLARTLDGDTTVAP
ncbi:MAG: TGS domain-containing protein, partial [Candidatus Binatia bacterium]